MKSNETTESNVLIMKGMNDDDEWLMRCSFSISIQRRWLEYLGYTESDIGEWCVVSEFEVDIPSLTDEGIQLNSAFNGVRDLTVRVWLWIDNDWDADSLDLLVRDHSGWCKTSWNKENRVNKGSRIFLLNM